METQPENKPADPLLGYEFGHYRIEGFLGSGGMGRVYKARHLLLDRVVALKVLPVQLGADPQMVSRFVREAKLTSELKHPHLVEVYDFGDSDYGYYIAMELVEGTNLNQLIHAQGKLNESQILEVAQQALMALAFAHEKGIIHRDIKPDNLLINMEGVLKITDLGLAKGTLAEHDSGLTMSGMTLGTPSYMPPEQIMDSRTIDARSDLYALGATLFHCAAGQPPFIGPSPVAIMNKHLKETPLNPRHFNPEISDETSSFILRLLQKNRDFRFRNAHEAEEAVMQILRKSPQDRKISQEVIVLDEPTFMEKVLNVAKQVGWVVLGLILVWGFWKLDLSFIKKFFGDPNTKPLTTIVSPEPSPSLPSTPPALAQNNKPQPEQTPAPAPAATPSFPLKTSPSPTFMSLAYPINPAEFPDCPECFTNAILDNNLSVTDPLIVHSRQSAYFKFNFKEIFQRMEATLKQKLDIQQAEFLINASLVADKNAKIRFKLIKVSGGDVREKYSVYTIPLAQLSVSPSTDLQEIRFPITNEMKKNYTSESENFGWILATEEAGELSVVPLQRISQETYQLIPRFSVILKVQENLLPEEIRNRIHINNP